MNFNDDKHKISEDIQHQIRQLSLNIWDAAGLTAKDKEHTSREQVVPAIAALMAVLGSLKEVLNVPVFLAHMGEVHFFTTAPMADDALDRLADQTAGAANTFIVEIIEAATAQLPNDQKAILLRELIDRFVAELVVTCATASYITRPQGEGNGQKHENRN